MPSFVAPFTIPISLVRGMVGGMQAKGMSPDIYLMKVGIAPQLLAQDHARVTSDQYIALMRALISGLKDESLALHSRALKPGSLELLASSALHEVNMAAALERVAHIYGLLQDDVVMQLDHQDQLAGLRLTLRTGAGVTSNFLHEFLVRVLWRLAAWLMGGELKVLRFDFAFDTPAYVLDYGATFPAECRFGQGSSAFWFDAKRLKRPMTRDARALHKFLATWPATAINPSRDGESVVEKVHAHLMMSRPHWASLASTASALHMSAPTLQRHLAQSSVTFQNIKNGLRRDIAISRLGTSRVSFTELAADLGFADAAAFQRAFKEWTGSPPGVYRGTT